jgi:catechol 2,3-dioxygenase-like lactoylglutathione lyase family enzyme
MESVQLEGVHHITAITGDAQKNVDFYASVLGLRLVKKTVNQDDPTVYHLFFADEKGDAGSDLTFFEYPGAPPGRAGDGMIHTVAWRVASPEAQLRALFGLTQGEARVATAIFEGMSMREASDALRIAHNTVRVQLARVYEKTGVTRQAELVKMMMRLTNGPG